MPPTVHQRRKIKAFAAEGIGIQAIGKRLGIPRGAVKLVLDSARQQNRRFACNYLPGVPQLTDDEADLAAKPAAMTDLDEARMTARIAEVSRSIREHKGEWAEGVQYA